MTDRHGDAQIRELDRDEWSVWRDLRLRSLTDAPDAFCADPDVESAHDGAWWADLVGRTVDHPRGALWCAEVGGAPVGIAFSRIDQEGVLHIGSMWVAPGGRSRGLGRSLVDTALAWGRAGGATTAELWVTVGNGHAETLYENAGFRDTGDRGALREGSALEIARMTQEL